MAKKMLIDWYS